MSDAGEFPHSKQNEESRHLGLHSNKPIVLPLISIAWSKLALLSRKGLLICNLYFPPVQMPYQGTDLEIKMLTVLAVSLVMPSLPTVPAQLALT